ncbi:MAG: iron ABC transporter substrate-binding protein, partial [Acidimicrobiia bacterium]|nr:iron ABC transporter substrate-binding protein [Acidimicrobiia bacterium]
MRTPIRLAFLALAFLASLLVACGGSDDGPSATDKPSGTGTGDTDKSGESLTLYSGRDEELIAPLIEQFTEDTGIEVEVRYGDSAEMGAQLLEEGDATPANVFYSQEVGAVGVLDEAGLLAELPSDVIDRVDSRFQPGKDHRWVGVTGRSRVIVYNPDLIDAPKGVEELTAEKYKGKVAIVPENAGFQAFITGFRVSQGEESARQWLEDLLANDPITDIESNGDVLEAVENGDVPIGLINHYYWARDERQPDMTSRLVFPEGDDPGGLVNATAVGITKGSADDDAALALVEYLLSEKGQTYFVEETFEYPVVDGIDDPEAIPALDELEGPDLDLTDLQSLEETQA